MKKLIIIAFVLFAINLNAQEIIEPSPIKWYDIETAEKLYKENPKPLLIDVYTDWCGWCKKMMKTTFAHQAIAGYINTNFYPVRLDAETKDTLNYKGEEYVNTGKVNELAQKLLNGRMSYPTLVFIDRQGQYFPVPGYQTIKTLEPLLIYFAEDLTKSVNFDEFNTAYMYGNAKVYKKELEKLPNDKKIDTTGTVNWYTFEEALEKNKKEPKMFFVTTHVDWCYSCKTMNKTTFSNPVISKIINEQFYPISFNAAFQKDITINDKTFKTTGKNNPHELATVLLNRQFFFPSIIFLNSKFEVITVVPGYKSSKSIEPILKYISEEDYTKVKFEDYLKTFKSEIK